MDQGKQATDQVIAQVDEAEFFLLFFSFFFFFGAQDLLI